jgi:hypothetical protein
MSDMNVMLRTVDKTSAAQTQAQLISETLADFAHDLAPAAIPAEVRERAKHLILDATASRSPPAATISPTRP